MDKKASHAADSLRSSDLPETDKALRDDVNRVGSLVGEILAEQEGEDFLDEVERIRVAAILRRENNASTGEMERELAGVDVAHATSLVRAFSTYFQAVGKKTQSMMLGLSRQFLLLIPIVLILPLFIGVDGVWMAFPIADLASTALTLALLVRELRHLEDRSA